MELETRTTKKCLTNFGYEKASRWLISGFNLSQNVQHWPWYLGVLRVFCWIWLYASDVRHHICLVKLKDLGKLLLHYITRNSFRWFFSALNTDKSLLLQLSGNNRITENVKKNLKKAIMEKTRPYNLAI